MLCQLLAKECLGHLVGLGGQVNILELLRIHGLSNKPGINKGDFKIGIVGVVGHFQVHFPVLPCFAGIEHGRVLLVEGLDVFHSRRIQDHNVRAVTNLHKLFRLDGSNALDPGAGEDILHIGHLEGHIVFCCH